MIRYHARTVLKRFSQRLQANHISYRLFSASMSDTKSKDEQLCDVYSTRIEDAKVYLSIADTRNLPDPPTENTITDTIPETVLQFERQSRKMKAAKKAEQNLTKEEHLKIVFQDEHLVVTDKPSGILCVPGIHNRSSLLTLVHTEFAPQIESMDKLIVHRLDMDTSGLVVFGRTLEVVSKMHQIFRDRLVEKSYQALVCGHVQVDTGTIDLPLQKDHIHPPFMRVATPKSELAAAQVVQDLQHHGWKKIMRRKPKPSTTEFIVLSREYIGGDADDDDNKKLPVTRLALKPITGRTHQLRVHCAALGHPIVGDPTYGVYGEASANGGILEEYMDTLVPHRASLSLQKQVNALQVEKMCLHAKELCLKHPITGEEMKWEAQTPF
mmetsp:Transcript_30606/g.50546  ORF Transcript_30606/g.50546 Transcript_30606/m.50546 type:complete len:382 (+) Transcript_30606:61-1206(+)